MEEASGRIIPLCGVQGCCPTAEFTGDSVVLRDDFEGKVTLTRDEWSRLPGQRQGWRAGLTVRLKGAGQITTPPASFPVPLTAPTEKVPS